jgi:hypothetical protein
MSRVIWQVFARIPDVGVTLLAAGKKISRAAQNLAARSRFMRTYSIVQ